MGIWAPIIVGSAIAGAGAIYGGSQAASAASSQAEAQNKATMARYQYDIEMWGMKKSQLQAQRQESVDRIMAEARNEGLIRAYKDNANQQQYDYSLQIRDAQQASNIAAFTRSEGIYNDTVDLNRLSAKSAMDSEILKLQELSDQQAFDRNETYIESIMAEGKMRARGVSGRSAAKGVQVTLADYGRQMEMLDATLDSAGRNTRDVLNEIIRDKTSADLVAYASKMLDPGELPMPIEAEPIPVAEISLPRVLGEYDFGPQPVMGAFASPQAAAAQVWGSTIASVAGSIGGAAVSGGVATFSN